MIHSIVASSMRLRTLVLVVAAIVMAIGITRLDDMPVDVFPEILPVTVSVQTEALGLSAAEVEQLITVPIEADLLAGTPWVDHMRSSSVPGLSSIELTFQRGTDPMHARQMVQERLTQAHALPNVSRPPQMLQPLSATNRVMLIGLSSKTESLIQMSVLARWNVRPRLMGVPGVANVAIWGQRERQLQVQVDPARLRDQKVTLMDIVETAGNALWYSPLSFLEASVAGTGGFIETPNQRLGIRHVLPISVAADLAKVPVEGTDTPLNQVANVIEDHQPLIGDAMNGGGGGLLMVIEKLPGANTLEVTDDVMDALEALKPGMGGVQFDPYIYNPAAYIRTSIRNIQGATMIALILMAIVLLLVSANWRAAVIGLVAIPLAITAAALVLFWSGATLNVMMVAGLVMALGVLVDDAVVYAEIVMRRLRNGPGGSIMRTLLQALGEARTPLIFATVVALLIGVPALFVAGAVGATVKPLVVAYSLAVAASLVVAMTVTPALALVLFQRTQLVRHESAFAGWVRRTAESMSPAMARAGIAAVVIAGLIGLVMLPQIQTPVAPRFQESDLLVHWDAVPGTSRQEMNRLLERASRELRTISGVRNVGAHVGRAILSDQVVGINSSEMWVNVDPGADYEKTIAAVEEVVAGYPGIDGDVMTFLGSRFGETLSRVDEPIVVRLYGQRQDLLEDEAEKVRQSLSTVNGIVDAHVEYEATEPVVEIKVDLAAAERHGVKPGDVRRAAATLLAGIEVGNLFEDQKVFEVVVWGAPHVRHSIAGIHDLLIDSPHGGHVRLGDVATVNIVSSPNAIHRENVARTLDVVAGVKGRKVDAVSADVRARLHNTSMPLEYRAELMGDYAARQSAVTRVAVAALGVALGIFFILQAAFGGWALALAVVLTLPVAVGGGLLAATSLDGTMSLIALGGLLTVLALTVRHAVVMIQYGRHLRTVEQMAFGPELVNRVIRDQAPAIVKSSLVVAAAALPFALLGNRAGHEVLGPLAIVILAGLVTGTLYALCVVPALYSRFGASAMPDAVTDQDLGIAV
jgi:Cu/Ag efflux pump CusA